jgi:hypothetical protein
LSTALSQRGYMKASTIMSLEQILAEVEQGRGQFAIRTLFRQHLWPTRPEGGVPGVGRGIIWR